MIRQGEGFMRFPNQHCGITLIEMLIGLIVLSLITVLALPNLQQWLERSRQNISLNQLVRILNQARNLAVMQGKSVGVCSGNDKKCNNSGIWMDQIMIFSDANRDEIISSEEILHLEYLAKDQIWHWNRTQALYFKPDGSLNGSNGTYCLYQDQQPAVQNGHLLKVIVSLAGRARVDLTSEAGSDCP